MSFEKGNVTFRMLYAPQELPEDLLERFTKNASVPLSEVGNEPVIGWVGGRHVLDLPITEENMKLAGLLRLILRKAERKIPAARLKAECAMVEQAKMQAENLPFLTKKVRKEIKEQIVARLLPLMEPSLKGTQFVYDGRERLVYVTATSDNQMDAFLANWMKTVGTDLIPVDPGTAAKQRKQAEARQWAPSSFSNAVEDSELENMPGADFLTWLWFWSETGGGMFKSDQLGEFALALEGPLLLERNGNGAHETALRKGLPTISADAKAALSGGKKLHQAKILLARGSDETWSFGFDADMFVFRSVKLPDPKEVLDAAGLFQNRMFKLGQMKDVVLALYDRFVEVRNDAVKWDEVKEQMRGWVEERAGKM